MMHPIGHGERTRRTLDAYRVVDLPQLPPKSTGVSTYWRVPWWDRLRILFGREVELYQDGPSQPRTILGVIGGKGMPIYVRVGKEPE
jgi:hypothetical protein